MYIIYINYTNKKIEKEKTSNLPCGKSLFPLCQRHRHPLSTPLLT